VTSIHQLNKELYSVGRTVLVINAERSLLAQMTDLSSGQSDRVISEPVRSGKVKERKPRAPRKPRVRRQRTRRSRNKPEPVCSECGGCKLVDLGEKDCFGRPVVYPCAMCIVD